MREGAPGDGLRHDGADVVHECLDVQQLASARILQYPKMVGDGRPRQVRALGYLAHAHAQARVLQKRGEDELARLVAQRDERRAAGVELPGQLKALLQPCLVGRAEACGDVVVHGPRPFFDSPNASTIKPQGRTRAGIGKERRDEGGSKPLRSGSLVPAGDEVASRSSSGECKVPKKCISPTLEAAEKCKVPKKCISFRSATSPSWSEPCSRPAATRAVSAGALRKAPRRPARGVHFSGTLHFWAEFAGGVGPRAAPSRFAV